jgi:uncharacterized protein YndB with AHSA1/START domain
MIRANVQPPDTALDLVLERIVDVPREDVWRAWTTPEYLKRWFTPVPWTTVDCEIDLRPGGIFRTVMRSPEGQESPFLGCYLEVIAERKARLDQRARARIPAGDYRRTRAAMRWPSPPSYRLAPHGSGTKYSALVIHGDQATRKRHADMGFHDGWGKALDQLVALAKNKWTSI